MQSSEIRKRFLEFFERRGHAVIPSASLVPENDPSVLFTTAGMQPLVPYLLGEKHPAGNRLVNIQKCVRTGDIDDIGDNTHATFFEMMGNWSLGSPEKPDGIGAGYFKEEAIAWSYELLTNKEEGFGLDPNRLYVTVFEGDENAPRDLESVEIWKKAGVPENRIYFLPAEKNWWSPGDNGPCGPDTEMFYDVSEKGLGDMAHEEFLAADNRQDIVEIWNDVFMEYEKKDGKVIGKLKQKNVDTGSGFERVVMVLQKKNNIFDTDIFAPIFAKIDEFTTVSDTKAKRIIADHIRTAVFMIADGVVPSNTDRGYILRRLIRRAVRFGDTLGFKGEVLSRIAEGVIETYREVYISLAEQTNKVKEIINAEEIKYDMPKIKRTLELLTKKFEIRKKELINPGKSFHSVRDIPKYGEITAKDVFDWQTRDGIDREIIEHYKGKYFADLQFEEGFEQKFNELILRHQDLSRAGAEKKFKGGLADTSDMSLKYHTATHLLHRALREVLGDHVEQKGSNITPERLRFDFVHTQKMTDEEKKKVEDLVNQKIVLKLPVQSVILPKEEALKTGAMHLFGEKYGDQISIYFIGNSLEDSFSKEFCGGPHVKNTGELGHFKIQKEEAVSAGIRRIKATLI